MHTVSKVLLALLAAGSSKALQPPNLNILKQRFQAAAKHPGSVVLIDGDNVRGKSGFRLSKEALLEGVRAVVTPLGLNGRTVLYFDHGAVHEAYIHESSAESRLLIEPNLGEEVGLEGGVSMDQVGRGGGKSEEDGEKSSGPLCIVFSGPSQSADDIIARDVHWWAGHLSVKMQEEEERATAVTATEKEEGGEGMAGARKKKVKPAITVVTDDGGLRGRCKKGIRGGEVAFWSSRTLAELVLQDKQTEPATDDHSVPPPPRAVEQGSNAAGGSTLAPVVGGDGQRLDEAAAAQVEAAVAAVRREQRLRAEISATRQALKHGCSRKKRTKYEKRLKDLNAKAIALAQAWVSSEQPVTANQRRGGQRPARLLDTLVAEEEEKEGKSGAACDGGGSPDSGSEGSGLSADERERVRASLLAAGARARRGGKGPAEQTWERVIYAERFRKDLVASAATSTQHERAAHSLASSFADYLLFLRGPGQT